MNLFHQENRKNRQSGFSLIDVMVGMVLSLIGTIVIFQVFEASENIKRTTTSGGNAQQNGVAALYMLQRELKEAGYGVNSGDGTVVPVQIASGVASTDTLAVTYRPNWDYGPVDPSSLAFPSAVPPAPRCSAGRTIRCWPN